MAALCGALSMRYVGKGKDRALYEGPCVLERGHDDLDHLPASLASKTSEDRVWNAALDAVCEALVANNAGEPSGAAQEDLLDLVRSVRRG
jgi:hypothetical protein